MALTDSTRASATARLNERLPLSLACPIKVRDKPLSPFTRSAANTIFSRSRWLTMLEPRGKKTLLCALTSAMTFCSATLSASAAWDAALDSGSEAGLLGAGTGDSAGSRDVQPDMKNVPTNIPSAMVRKTPNLAALTMNDFGQRRRGKIIVFAWQMADQLI